MGSFNEVGVELVSCKYCTSNGTNTDGGIKHSHFFQNFSNKFMYYAVGAAGAIVHFSILKTFGLYIYIIHLATSVILLAISRIFFSISETEGIIPPVLP